MANKLFNQGRFNFIGALMVGKESITHNKSDKSDWTRTRLNVGIKADSNSQFVNMEYMHSDKVKTVKIFGKDGESFEVNSADTTKASNIEKSAEFTRIVIDLETDFDKKSEYTKLIYKVRNHEKDNAELLKNATPTEADKAKIEENNVKIAEYTKQIEEMATNRVEFCHIKDAMSYLESNLALIKDKKLRMTGNVKSNYYKSKNNLQYIPNFIDIVADDTADQLKVYLDVFYEKDSIDDDKKLKKMVVNGYVGERVKKADKLYPLAVVVDYTRIDEENPEHMMLLDFMKNTFRITDKKQVHKIAVEINAINGAEVVEFDESCLTPEQQMAVKLGLNKIEDFKPKGNTYGDRIVELRVVKPVLKGDFVGGSLEVFAVKDLPDYLVADDSDVKASDTQKEKEPEKEDKPASSPNDLMNKLFG